MPEYVCSNCGRKHVWHEAKKIDPITGLHVCIKCNTPLDSEKDGNQTQLPKQGEPLVCAFQRQFNAPYRIQCALTGIGSGGGAISRVFANYEPCKIDICPQFQNMRMNKKIVSWLEMEK